MTLRDEDIIMDENLPQIQSGFSKFLRYNLILIGLMGIGFDIWWFLDAQSNEYINSVLMGLTVVSILSIIGFLFPQKRVLEKYTLFLFLK